MHRPRGPALPCLFLLAFILLIPAVSATQYDGTLAYDTGGSSFFYFFKDYGHAVHFTNSDNLTIEGIRIYGCKWNPARQDASVTISIWDDNFNTLYQDQVPYSSIALNGLSANQKCVGKWFEVQLPTHKVSGNFYVSVFTDSTPVSDSNHGIEIGYTSISKTQTSHTTLLSPNRIDDQPVIQPPPSNRQFAESDIDWMIRVHYVRIGNGTSSGSSGSGSSPGFLSSSPIPVVYLAAGGVLVLAVIGVLGYIVIKRRKPKGAGADATAAAPAVPVPGGPAPAMPATAAGPLSSTHHDVFVSYAHLDKPTADAVCARLEARQIRCWIAPRDVPPGMEFPAAIIQGIEGSRVMVLVFSSHSNVSPHVLREITSAVNKGIIIVPFRIEEVLPSKSMEYLISVPHWLDAVTPPLEQHVDLLATTIEKILSEHPRQDDGNGTGPGP